MVIKEKMVIIPSELQPQMLEQLHNNHMIIEWKYY